MSSATAINMTTGVKGSDVYATTGSPLLDLSVMLNRGLDQEVINSAVKRIVSSGDAAAVEDLFVLAFQTRDVRGGKGERDLFKHLMCALNTELSSVTLSTLDLVPEYGCWRDVFALAQGPALLSSPFVAEIEKVVAKQLASDEAALAAASASGDKPKLSLLAKWLPKEHSNKGFNKALAQHLARTLNPGSRTPDADYRKRVAKLNTALKTVEIAMCDGRFSDIDPKSVPGRALAKYRAAFLNEPVKGEHGRKTKLTVEDRMECEKRFREHFAAAAAGKATVKGANTVFPHELVSRVLRGEGSCDVDERNAIQAQWNSIRDAVKASGGLNRCLAMCDFSGSMSGTPMDVSMALGCLISECNKGGAFEDYILTFDSTPTLHKFSSEGIVERVNEVRPLAQGLSTDFQAAYNLVLKHLVDNAVPVGQEPKDLIVLTDMGWDQACGFGQHSAYTGMSHRHAVKTQPQESHITIARRAFQKAGETLFGEGNGWQAPRIVIWNLRAEYADFHATASTEGVVQVSGWSPSLLKVLTTRGVDALTPDAMLRAQLEDPRYDAVRSRVHAQLPAALTASKGTLRGDLAARFAAW